MPIITCNYHIISLAGVVQIESRDRAVNDMKVQLEEMQSQHKQATENRLVVRVIGAGISILGH